MFVLVWSSLYLPTVCYAPKDSLTKAILMSRTIHHTWRAQSRRIGYHVFDIVIMGSWHAADNPRDWPGPKVWPATLGLFSFFAINIFGQALFRA